MTGVTGVVGVECGCCCRRVLAVGLETCTPDWKGWRWNGPACRLPFPIHWIIRCRPRYVGTQQAASMGPVRCRGVRRLGRVGGGRGRRCCGQQRGRVTGSSNNNNRHRCWRRLVCCRGELQLGEDWPASRWDDGPGARFLRLIWVIRVIWGRSNGRLPEKHSKPARGQQSEPGPEPARNATQQGKAEISGSSPQTS